jgi:hypothetical protein
MTPSGTRLPITLFGTYRPRPGDRLYQAAYDIGLGLARAGFDLINGGHDGVMAASAHGARDGGAHVTGVTCSSVRKARQIDTNPHLHEIIDADSLLDRIDRMMQPAAGFVVLPGGTGTLAELGVVWEHVAKGFLPARPIVLLTDFWRPIVEAIAKHYPAAATHIHFAETPEQVVAIIREKLAPQLERMPEPRPSGRAVPHVNQPPEQPR